MAHENDLEGSKSIKPVSEKLGTVHDPLAPVSTKRKTHPILDPQPAKNSAGHTLLATAPPIARQFRRQLRDRSETGIMRNPNQQGPTFLSTRSEKAWLKERAFPS